MKVRKCMKGVSSKEYSAVYQDSLWVLQGKGELEKDTATVAHRFSQTKGFVETLNQNNRGAYFNMKLKEVDDMMG